MLINDGKISSLFSMETLFLGNRVNFLENQTQIFGKFEFLKKKSGGRKTSISENSEIRRSQRIVRKAICHCKALINLILEQTKQLISNSAANTLDRFCGWQAKLNVNRTDDHPLYHDLAILLTRTDLCRSGSNCLTLGLAHSAKICVEKSSCAIVEDSGLSTSLTIAHEIGHKYVILTDQ